MGFYDWSSAEQGDDLLNGLVGFVVSGFEFGIGTMGGVGLMMKATIGQRTAKPLVKEEEQQRDLALGGEPIAVAGTVALK